ncbi:hypothetical protein Aeh1ORF251c [Aeromonas phage Aeh1]|uniref:Uncharacterized protein n=1 Tax=Aeromonas phage Aeh1 TaxID=2880362 RepID=Q76YI2_9CAUD|nr:hydrolase [Aeromonas phage Aeh1]AAQ17913.1 hypothetical protein Aeh1ORF251c [Aeromonas phage Aeh1]
MKKCYVFINRYLGDKQAGIQAAHAVTRMMINPPTDVLLWAGYHETIVLLNGGDHDDLKALAIKYGEIGNGMHSFNEPGLNHAITAVAMVPTPAMEEVIERYKSNIKNGFITAPNGSFETLCDIIAKAHSFRG